MLDFYPKPEVKLKTFQISLFAICRPSPEFFTRSYGDVTIVDEGLQF